MAATKLNPAAPPFFHPHALHHFAPPPPPSPPPPMVPCHAGGVCWPPSPHGTIYLCDPFPVPSPHLLLHHHHYDDYSVFGLPVLPLPQQVVTRKGMLAAAAAPPPPPHGLPPHKLMCSAGGAEKLPAATVAQVTSAVPVKGLQEPEPPAATAAGAVVDVRALKTPAPCGTRVARQKAESWGAFGARRPRKSAGPRAWVAAGARARPPAPKFTRRVAALPPCVPPAFGSATTTVMVRNIPNKIKYGKMIELLDDYCACANKTAGAVIAAYDVFYLPMDFRRLGNFGYAFVNFTTPAAALGLRNVLHGSGWTIHGSKKIIHVCPAKIQGKEALERHFGRQKLECHTAEFLPAVYSPPRDGVTGGVTAPRRLGSLVAPRRPRQAATAAYAPGDTHPSSTVDTAGVV
ncbi:hypothetical protein ACP4OV_009710 [Aristida adscensionis]